jgi:hypothetical protein
LTGLGVTLAAAHVVRSEDWASAWKRQTAILAEAPVAGLRNTPQGAIIVFINPLSVNGAPIFTEAWDLSSAIPWKYPDIQGRAFWVYHPKEGALDWDGTQLRYGARPALAESRDVYLWQPAQHIFTRAAGGFHVTPQMTVEPD